ncbi:MAG: tRNA (adenosine(37)-N6)-threonylcarbamoyltransferase complex transferase subunit TsaD [Calditrichota bacterium]
MKSAVLGIETSCDETSAALWVDDSLAAERTTTQLLHSQYGGVVPELASRAHEQLLAPAVRGVCEDAGLSMRDLTAVAVTNGPGLAGALLVGLSFAKGLALTAGIPLLGVNHLEGHLWSATASGQQVECPFLALLISGGHTMMVKVRAFGEYQVLGGTRDDAAGELLDKTGRMMGYPFPAGANLDRDRLLYDRSAKQSPIPRFPRARIADDPLSFSFSGLKTAVLYYMRRNYNMQDGKFQLDDQERVAISAGIMDAVGDILINGLEAAFNGPELRGLVVAGGVAASRYLTSRFQEFTSRRGIAFWAPPFNLCTDNAAMIAYVGRRRLQRGESSPLDLSLNPTASLESFSAK